ncbi:MAG: hypothetical protein Q8Q32_02660 [bacterium]|nr:hypothetical protein [bacterium]
MFGDFDLKNINLATWEGANYIDRWTIPHIVTGFTLALLFPFLGFSRRTSFFIAAVLIVMWEVYEIAMGIYEPEVNRIMDVVAGLVGYGFGFLVNEKNSTEVKKYSLIVGFLVGVITSAIGWLAYIGGAR